MPRLRPLLFAPLVLAALSCRLHHPEVERARKAEVVQELPQRASGTYVLGAELLPEGSVAAEAAGDTFTRGGRVYLSIQVAGATHDQEIEVDWLDARGRVLGREERIVPRRARYAAFAATTGRWAPGPYRVLVIIDGRRVNEQEFRVA